MSTSYYRLVNPITRLRLEEGAAHDRLTVFENGVNAGTLTLSKGVGRRLAMLFAVHKEDNECPLRTHFGGVERGCVVTINDHQMSDCATVIDEHGEIHTVAEVKAMDGRGKRE